MLHRYRFYLEQFAIELPTDRGRHRNSSLSGHRRSGFDRRWLVTVRATLGEFVVLLNNDTIVTRGWLSQLTGLATFTTGIGLVGPMSNMAAPPQLVETVSYRTSPNPRTNGLIDVGAVDRFAEKHHAAEKGNWMYADRLGGFCLLFKREVLDKVGKALDQWTDLGLFDSDILSAKGIQAGYSLAVCRDLFVHHFGTRTFAHAPTAMQESIRWSIVSS